jgi:cold shock CspA family protein
MHGYIQPGFAHSQKQREVDKLTAILQALKNCHNSLGTIKGGEEIFEAKEDLADLFLRIDAIRMEKMKRLESNANSSNAVTLDTEFIEDSDLALMD